MFMQTIQSRFGIKNFNEKLDMLGLKYVSNVQRILKDKVIVILSALRVIELNHKPTP